MILETYWVDRGLAHGLGLTKRQQHVLVGIAKGLTNAEIGRQLFLSEDTVKTHVKNLFRRLGVNDRAGAVALAYDGGLLRTREGRIAAARDAGIRVVA